MTVEPGPWLNKKMLLSFRKTDMDIPSTVRKNMEETPIARVYHNPSYPDLTAKPSTIPPTAPSQPRPVPDATTEKGMNYEK